MRRTVVGVIAVVTASSVFTLTGLGIASAMPLSPNTPPSATATFSAQSEAATIQTLHDQLAAEWQAKNAAAMQATTAELATELANLRAPQAHAALSPDTASKVNTAQDQNTELAQELAALPHGNSAGDLPPVPGLGSLASLVQSLLATLLSIVTGLLGGLPVPAPPGLPVSPPSLPVSPPTLPVSPPPVGH